MHHTSKVMKLLWEALSVLIKCNTTFILILPYIVSFMNFYYIAFYEVMFWQKV